MIAPDSFRAQRHRRQFVGSQRSGAGRPGGPGARSRAVLPGAGDHDHGRNVKGDSTLSVDDVVSDSDRKKPRYHFDRQRRGVPARSSSRSPRRCTPSARWRGRRPTAGIGSRPAATRSSSSPAAPRSPTTTTSTTSAGLQGHLHPHRQTRQRGARRHPGNGRPRTPHLPQRAQPYLSPAAVKRWEPFIHDDHPRLPRREDRRQAASTSSTTWPTSCPPC